MNRQQERRRWRGMLNRCENPRNSSYRYYGARGIKVCERWHDFENYYADIMRLLGPCPGGKSLDRIDNDGDYEPANVRWAGSWLQSMNSRGYGRPRNPELRHQRSKILPGQGLVVVVPGEVIPARPPGPNRWAEAARKRWDRAPRHCP